jgi:drug/metabolite transporter (DMT)-like permease
MKGSDFKRRLSLFQRQRQRRAMQMSSATRGMLWAALAGLMLSSLNAIVRSITLDLDVYQSLFLRYGFGMVVMLPWVLRNPASYRPKDIKGQFWRGIVHTLGLTLWFTALPHISLADMTALGFTGPIFIMLGAAWFLGEKMRADRWVAALIGFGGVLVVVGPQLTGAGGWYTLIMLSSSPMFAASFLITKALTRYETPSVIVFWQALMVTLLGLPLALWFWQAPTLWQWVGFGAAGILGSLGHYCLTRAFKATDISTTQSLRFLDLVWATLLGWLVFSDVPRSTTLLGALVIMSSTIWIARRESRGSPPNDEQSR